MLMTMDKNANICPAKPSTNTMVLMRQVSLRRPVPQVLFAQIPNPLCLAAANANAPSAQSAVSVRLWWLNEQLARHRAGHGRGFGY